MKQHTEVKMTELQYCDYCKQNKGTVELALYDGRTHMGPWAYMCAYHFAINGVGLGLGKGQKLIYNKEVKQK